MIPESIAVLDSVVDDTPTLREFRLPDADADAAAAVKSGQSCLAPVNNADRGNGAISAHLLLNVRSGVHPPVPTTSLPTQASLHFPRPNPNQRSCSTSLSSILILFYLCTTFTTNASNTQPQLTPGISYHTPTRLLSSCKQIQVTQVIAQAIMHKGEIAFPFHRIDLRLVYRTLSRFNVKSTFVLTTDLFVLGIISRDRTNLIVFRLTFPIIVMNEQDFSFDVN